MLNWKGKREWNNNLTKVRTVVDIQSWSSATTHADGEELFARKLKKSWTFWEWWVLTKFMSLLIAYAVSPIKDSALKCNSLYAWRQIIMQKRIFEKKIKTQKKKKRDNSFSLLEKNCWCLLFLLSKQIDPTLNLVNSHFRFRMLALTTLNLCSSQPTQFNWLL